jgi:hypothetical protein
MTIKQMKEKYVTSAVLHSEMGKLSEPVGNLRQD